MPEANHRFNISIKSMSGDLYIVPFIHDDNVNYLSGVRVYLMEMYPEAFPEDVCIRFFSHETDVEKHLIDGIHEGQIINFLLVDNRPVCQHCSEHFHVYECCEWSEDPQDRCRPCRQTGYHWHDGCPPPV
jgi:hypothetical protein